MRQLALTFPVSRFIRFLIITTGAWNGCLFSITLNAPLLQDTYISSSSNLSYPTAQQIFLIEPASSDLRGFIQFDLSGIPYGAVIVSASLQFEVTSAPSGAQFEIQYTPFSWNENTITYSGQPWANGPPSVISDMPQPISAPGLVGPVILNVTSHVDYMTGRRLSYGWMIRMTSSSASPIVIASNDNSNQTIRPKLTIQYYLPCTITAVTSPAATSMSNDGTTDITVNGGSGNFSYQWFDPSGSPLANTQDVANLSPGVYKLEVTDNAVSKTYRQFVVIGNVQNAMTVTLQPDETYGVDAYVRNALSVPFGPPSPEPFRNYGTDNFLRSGITAPGNYACYLKFNYIGLEETNSIAVEGATLGLSHNTHVDQGKGLSYKLKRVTQTWYEDYITQLNLPTATTVQEKNIDAAVTPNPNTDITDFAQLHNQNPSSNHGYFIDWYPNGSGSAGTSNYVNFHSSAGSVGTLRPQLIITFRIKQDYFELKKKPDGSLYNVYNLLRFRYVENYNDTDGALTYAIYKVQDNDLVYTQASQTLPVQPGDNRYVLNLKSAGLQPGVYRLEVTNEKKEKSYLRFNLN